MVPFSSYASLTSDLCPSGQLPPNNDNVLSFSVPPSAHARWTTHITACLISTSFVEAPRSNLKPHKGLLAVQASSEEAWGSLVIARDSGVRVSIVESWPDCGSWAEGGVFLRQSYGMLEYPILTTLHATTSPLKFVTDKADSLGRNQDSFHYFI